MGGWDPGTISKNNGGDTPRKVGHNNNYRNFGKHHHNSNVERGKYDKFLATWK